MGLVEEGGRRTGRGRMGGSRKRGRVDGDDAVEGWGRPAGEAGEDGELLVVGSVLAHDLFFEAEGAEVGEGLRGAVEGRAGALGDEVIVVQELEVVFADGDAEAGLEFGRAGGDVGEGGAEGLEVVLADEVALVVAHSLAVELDFEVVEDLFAVHLEVFAVFLGELAVSGCFQQLLVQGVDVLRELGGYASEGGR